MRVQTPMARRWQKGDVVDDRQTHPLNFAAFDERWGPFTVDVAASQANTKCARFYTSTDDGLAQSWADEIVWCNPPYSKIKPWIRKAWAEHVDAVRIVMLLPANRTQQGWWQSMVEPFRDRPGSPLEARFLPGRMHFLRPGQTAVQRGERPPFGCVLLIWDSSEGSRHVYDPDAVTGGLFG